MSLLATQTTSAPQFEEEFETLQAASVATQAPTTALSTTAAPTQIAAQSKSFGNPLSALKDSMAVEYNTLEALILTQGNIVSRETKKSLGDSIQLELLSYQDSWVVAPNDEKAPVSVVRFSNDGVMCSDGVTTVKEQLQWLHTNGYPKASLKQRVIIVGAVEKCAKNQDMLGSLVQIDLSPASRAKWLRYEANCAYKVEKKLCDADKVKHVVVTAELATAGSNTYTLANFTTAV